MRYFQERKVGPAMAELHGTASRANGVLAAGNKCLMGQVVAAQGGLLVPWQSGMDAAGVLVTPIDASEGDTPAAYLARTCDVHFRSLVYPPGADGEVALSLGRLRSHVRFTD